MTLKEILGLDGVVDVDRAGLPEELVRRRIAGARDRLIGGHHDAADTGGVMQRLEGDDELCRRAIGVGDDVLLPVVGERLRVHFGDDERHLGIRAEVRGIVDHHGTGRRGLWRIFGGHAAAGGEEGDVDIREIERVESFDLERTIPEMDLLAERLARGERGHGARRKGALGEDVEHLLADETGGSDNGDMIAHRFRAPVVNAGCHS